MNNMSNGRLALFVVTLLLLNFAVVADLAVIAAYGAIYEAFADQPSLVNFIISGPALLSAIAALVTGILMQYFSKKTLLLVGFGLFAVGGTLGAAVEDALYVAAMRALVGVGYGIVMVSAVSLIAEVFTNEKQRGTIMGLNNAASTGIGAAVSFLAGILAVTSWTAIFNLYWLAVPILVMAIIFIPKTPPDGRRQTGGASGATERIPLGVFGLLMASAIAFTLGWAIVYYNTAFYVPEKGLGDAAVVGTYLALTTVGAAVGALLFGPVYARLRSGSILVAYAVMLAAILALLLANNTATAGVAWAVAGVAFGFGYTYFMMHATVVAPPTRMSLAIGLVIGFTGFAFFASTYLTTFLMGLLGVDTILPVIPVAMAILAIGAALSFVGAVRDSRPVA